MDAYDEIFDFLDLDKDKRIACLKHLLHSSRASLNSSTKGKIYERVTDHDAPMTVTVTPKPASPRSDEEKPSQDKKSPKDPAFNSCGAESLAEKEPAALSADILAAGHHNAGNKITVKNVKEYKAERLARAEAEC